MTTKNRGSDDVDDDRIGQLVHDFVAGIEVGQPAGPEWRQRLVNSSAPTARRPLYAVIGALTIVAALLVAVSLRGLPTDRSGTVPQSTSASTPPNSVGTSHSQAPTEEVIAPSTPDLSQLGWFSMRAYFGCAKSEEETTTEAIDPCADPGYPRDAGWKLTVGLFNGQRRTLEKSFQDVRDPAVFWRAMPFGALVGNDTVLFGYFDGRQSELSLHTVSPPSDELLFQSDRPISAAVMHLASGRFYAALVESDSRRDAGIWVGRQGDSDTELLVAPRSDVAADQQINGWERSLYLTPDGSRLAIVDCQDRRCDVRVHDAQTGALQVAQNELRQDAIFGITNTALYGVFSCPAQPCGVSGLSLASGEVALLPIQGCPTGYGVVGSVVPQSQSLLVAVQLPSCGGRNAVVAWDSAGTARTVELAGEKDAEFVAATTGVGYALPSGWVLLGLGGEILPVQSDARGPWLVGTEGEEVIDLRLGK